MLSSKTQYNLVNAKTYFSEYLSVGDYYMGEEVGGLWFGKGAKALGLTGRVGEAEFLRLCDNLHPQTGNLLTQRKKTFRKEVGPEGAEKNVTNRRVFYDFTISTPKSVSILALIGEDQRIIEAHDRATRVAMKEMETFAAARVRSGGPPAMSWPPTSGATPPAPWTPIFILTAFSSTLLLIPWKVAGKRWRTSICFVRRNM